MTQTTALLDEVTADLMERPGRFASRTAVPIPVPAMEEEGI
jgi:hypothetical protein